MKWKQTSATSILSDQGYKVAKFGREPNVKYRASNPIGQWLGEPVKTAKKAMELCEVDFGRK